MNPVLRRLPFGIFALLAIGVGLAAVLPYATFDPANFNNATRRFAIETPLRQLNLYLHAFGGGLALLLGVTQFMTRLRVRRPVLHRWLGRVYLIAVTLAGLSAFVIAPGTRGGLSGEVGLLMLAVLWLITGFMAYRTIRRGDVAQHREWMLRNYALTFGAVTLRLWLGVLIMTQVPQLMTRYGGNFDALFDTVYPVVMWLAWVPNLIVMEWWLNRRRMPGRTLVTGAKA